MPGNLAVGYAVIRLNGARTGHSFGIQPVTISPRLLRRQGISTPPGGL
jgi:hypothetical protein